MLFGKLPFYGSSIFASRWYVYGSPFIADCCQRFRHSLCIDYHQSRNLYVRVATTERFPEVLVWESSRLTIVWAVLAVHSMRSATRIRVILRL
jgi:hypothetical protein